jgi:hypothetical protein
MTRVSSEGVIWYQTEWSWLLAQAEGGSSPARVATVVSTLSAKPRPGTTVAESKSSFAGAPIASTWKDRLVPGVV